MPRIKEISLVFPCFNERDNIGKLVHKALPVVTELAEEYEIVVVDDGSSDGTDAVAARLAEEFPQVRVISHSRNRGYGAALRSGFLAATKELVFYTDGDNQFDIAELAGVLPLLRSFDIISGYRESRADRLTRRVNARLYQLALFLLFGLRIRDIDCAFKIYPRELFDRMAIESDGAVVDAEILLKARKLGYRIGQIGVSHYPRTTGEQSGARLGVVLRAFRELIALRLRL